MTQPTRTREDFQAAGRGRLPGLMGVEILTVAPGEVSARLEIRDELLAPNGYLHAASVVALADTAAGYGCVVSLPDGASGFTTIELKSNFFGTARSGAIRCTARMLHGGRRTQVWEADVSDETTGRAIARFACTQLVLWP